MLAASAFALIGFPLDDVWHRIFGQDVTLWGPTHLMLIGGAGPDPDRQLDPDHRGSRRPGRASRDRRLTAFADRVVATIARYRRSFAVGGLLIGLSTFQAEFDFGVPQFQLVLEPIMLAFAAGVALVAARIWIGPGGALGAAIFFVAVRGAIALIVGPVLGETTPHLPLYLVEALCVEGAALVVSPRRGYSFGALAGALIGTVGFFAEYAWSHIWMPVAWPSSLIGEAILPALVTAIAAGILGAYLGGSFAAAGSRRERFPAPPVRPRGPGDGRDRRRRRPQRRRPDPERLERPGDARRRALGPERTVDATVRIDPAAIGDDAYWLQAIAWQGGGLVVDPLERVGPGVYETTKPIPVHGTWKALIRLQRDNYVAGVPIYLPEDSAIPAPAVNATASFERPFVDETEILQRELKSGVPGYLAGIAYSIVAAIVLGLLLLLGWVLNRIARPEGGGDRRDPATARPRSTAREATA